MSEIICKHVCFAAARKMGGNQVHFSYKPQTIRYVYMGARYTYILLYIICE